MRFLHYAHCIALVRFSTSLLAAFIVCSFGEHFHVIARQEWIGKRFAMIWLYVLENRRSCLWAPVRQRSRFASNKSSGCGPNRVAHAACSTPVSIKCDMEMKKNHVSWNGFVRPNNNLIFYRLLFQFMYALPSLGIFFPVYFSFTHFASVRFPRQSFTHCCVCFIGLCATFFDFNLDEFFSDCLSVYSAGSFFLFFFCSSTCFGLLYGRVSMLFWTFNTNILKQAPTNRNVTERTYIRSVQWAHWQIFEVTAPKMIFCEANSAEGWGKSILFFSVM